MSRNSAAPSESEKTLERITDHIRELGGSGADRGADGGLVRGLYLYGSAMSSTGLKPDSDVDLLLVTSRSLASGERGGLVRMLLGVSGWRRHHDTYPEVAGRRPVELTSVVARRAGHSPVVPRTDFQFGEWLRGELIESLGDGSGTELHSGADPSRAGGSDQAGDSDDVIILLAYALTANRALLGPRLESLVGPVPRGRLAEAIMSTLREVLGGLEGDARNSLLTLARMLVTLESGEIVSKDAAAAIVAPELSPPGTRLLERARAEYLGTAGVGHGNLEDPESLNARNSLADELVARIHEVARR